MKYQKFNKYEKKEIRAKVLANALHGEGIYLYENRLDGDLTLPRPTKSGLREVGPKQQFQGDSYYLQMVRSGELRLIKELQSPQQQREQQAMQEKLILDQPDMITEQGKVEHVSEQPRQPLNEMEDKEKPDVLINETPCEDGFVIVGV